MTLHYEITCANMNLEKIELHAGICYDPLLERPFFKPLDHLTSYDGLQLIFIYISCIVLLAVLKVQSKTN